jgi:cytochrome P450
MTAPPPDHPRTGAPAASMPPPECPAHALGADGLQRLYGSTLETDLSDLYQKLRAEHGAVAPVLVPGDQRAWLVLGHRENLEVARTPYRFSRDSRNWHAMRDGVITNDHPLAPISAWQPLCNFADGQEHKRLRGAVTDSTARLDGRGVRRHVTRFAHALIDEFCSDGKAELVSQFAEHLPMRVMVQILGMSESYGSSLVEAARDMIQGTETAVASNEYVTGALRQLVARKRTEPGADLASWLIEHPAELTDTEVEQHLRLLLIMAFESTANLIANTLRMVLTDRRFRGSLAGGQMTLPDALEQVLWDTPPLTTILGRCATGDTQLGGQQIKAGDALLLGLAAGNLDPEIRPDLAAPVHGNRSHLAFGAGPHECPGQDIGRAIADTGIEVLLSRLPDLRLTVPDSELEYASSLMTRHLVALPAEFTRTSPAPERPTRTARRPMPSITLPEEQPETGAAGAAPGATGAQESIWSALLRRLGLKS